ncbi:MAG: site-2 protease family protein [Solirubrobacteraceae bacterium]
MRETFTLGRILGVRITVTATWFVWLFAMVWLLSDAFTPDGQDAAAREYGLAVLITALYVGSLVGHELGHALAARRYGMDTDHVELWILGGFAHLSRESRTPREELCVAAAGPAVTFVIAVLAAVTVGIAEGFAPATIWEIATLQRSAETTVGDLAGLLLFVEGISLLFNLLPALPLDGGRMTRALVWKVGGDPARATALTAASGRGLAIVLAAGGVAMLLGGERWLLGVALLFTAWFVWENARMAVRFTPAAPLGVPLTAAELMDARPPWLAVDDTVSDALRHTFEPFGLDWAPVLDAQGAYRGTISAGQAQGLVEAERPDVPVGSLLEPDAARDAPRLAPDTPLDLLARDKRLRRFGTLPVVDGDGTMIGVLSADTVRRAAHEDPSRAGG